MGDAAGKATPEQSRETARGPAGRRPAQASTRHCLQILREEPHPHDEQADPARDPREELVHGRADRL